MKYLCIEAKYKDLLGTLRHWSNLKIGFDEDLVWVKDFTTNQADAVELKSIPYKKMYREAGNKLFPENSALPERNAPAVLWTPIEFGLPLCLPNFNHNYFGLEHQADIKLIDAVTEQTGFGLLVTLADLRTYLEKVSNVRLEPLQWTIIGTQAFIIGTPLLPINGESYWRRGNMLLPTGLDFELPILTNILEKTLKPHNDWLVWDRDNQYFLIEKYAFMPLSISSFRLSFIS